ncbi:RHS repeat-associated core domain-containing protein [Pseudomonas vancouverensis]|uniref:RHS repeat-associated core domain-containing protein n=1 Tax=Pseudomonas vancouverensis TaxID=95300 RepID=A0A1H2PEF8_PSEVA|nr:RHS repeat-associated core domain-containing protein [Pseudomonas vancouverensis]KAB0493673.1 RHS repeat-associated core domain-containing protein [Pseudomonas vancouverensis]TDB67750.1 RHS repeat-associated core domain-containing protein [Pseudomonas vancouverensis]SDV15396.1 RHS repeat-associated core domain-containing protein [Pseudomonas vancouverensis]
MRTINQLLQRYRYDALDVLIQVEPVGQVTQTRFYRGEHLVTQLNGQNSQSVFQHHKQLLALHTHEDNQSRSQLLATDQQRSVLQAGPVQQRYAPYGHRLASSGLDSLLGFTGEVPDRMTGHYLLGNGHRAFNPVLMRFNSPDSLSPFGRGGLNSYAYCLGDPVNFTDPTGQFTEVLGLFRSVGGLFMTKLGMSRVIPSYNVAKDALKLGALTKLSPRQAFTAFSTVAAAKLGLAAGVFGTAALVTSSVKEGEAAEVLTAVAGGLLGLAMLSRAGTYFAAKNSGAEAGLINFVKNKGQVIPPTPPSSRRSLSIQMSYFEPSAPPQTPGTPRPSAPPLSAGATDAGFFNFPPQTNRTAQFLNTQLDRQLQIFRDAKKIRRHSL